MRKSLRFCLCSLLLELASASYAQMSTSYWVNVKDFGAKGDGKTDDSAAIVQAALYAEGRGQNGGNVVYFPPSPGGGYVFNGQLPALTDGVRVTLFLDARIFLTNTLLPSKGYVIHGNSSGQIDAFSTEPLAGIAVGAGATPAIWIHSQAGVRLENLEVQYVNYGSDGIVIDGSSAKIDLKNVFVNMHGDATSGVPLFIKGGFGYEIDGGGYSSPSSSSSPSIEFSDDGICDFAGILHVRHSFMAGHGIALTSVCGGLNSVSFEDILYESGVNAFLTINSQSSLGVWGIQIKDVNFADSLGNPKPPLIDAHCKCEGIWGVQIVNSWTDGPQLTTGDPISDLEVWSPSPITGYQIAQTTGYVLHRPFAVYNAMPTYLVGGAADFSVSPGAQTTQSVNAGQSASYPLTVVASVGFNHTVALSCSGGPPGSTCVVSPNSTNLTGPASSTATATVTTTSQSNGSRVLSKPAPTPARYYGTALLFATLLVVVSFAHGIQMESRQRPMWASASIFFVLMLFTPLLSSCAGVVAS